MYGKLGWWLASASRSGWKEEGCGSQYLRLVHLLGVPNVIANTYLFVNKRSVSSDDKKPSSPSKEFHVGSSAGRGVWLREILLMQEGWNAHE